MSDKIPFSWSDPAALELHYLQQVVTTRQLQGDGPMTSACEDLIKSISATDHAVLVHSGTAALELSALVLDLGPGDEVILPSFTFTSTANAIALRRAIPVFVDIDPDTQNIDPVQVEAAITDRTKAICVVHYAGVVADMVAVQDIANRHNLAVIEDAAQALGSSRDGKPAGSFGDLACFSFHETKNIVAGEGGALVTNQAQLLEAAEVAADKGANRKAYFKGMVDKYQWVDLGSSYHPSELVAAVLRAQLEEAGQITADRMSNWATYHEALAPLEASGHLLRPVIPDGCTHNAHMYYIKLSSAAERDRVMQALRAEGIMASFHYIPLHQAPAGLRYGRAHGELTHTNATASQLLRLPLFRHMGDRLERCISRTLAIVTNS